MLESSWMAALVVVAAAGLIRGITGFGGAMVMAPLLGLMLGPVPAVVIALALETAAAAVILPEAWRHMGRRTLLLLALPACAAVPIGASLLTSLDPVLARRLIGGTVVLFSSLLLTGFRYDGAPRRTTSVALGSIAGLLIGATSVGAPPVILYLLSGPDPHAVTRANLIAFISLTSAAGVAALIAAGAISLELAAITLALGVPYLVGTWIGGRLSRRFSEKLARRFALALMLAIGTAALVT